MDTTCISLEAGSKFDNTIQMRFRLRLILCEIFSMPNPLQDLIDPCMVSQFRWIEHVGCNLRNILSRKIVITYNPSYLHIGWKLSLIGLALIFFGRYLFHVGESYERILWYGNSHLHKLMFLNYTFFLRTFFTPWMVWSWETTLSLLLFWNKQSALTIENIYTGL